MVTKFRVQTDGNIFIVQGWKDSGWGRRKWVDVTSSYGGPSSFLGNRAYFYTLLDAQKFIIQVIREREGFKTVSEVIL